MNQPSTSPAPRMSTVLDIVALVVGPKPPG